jgi:Ig-like domain-containing protein
MQFKKLVGAITALFMAASLTSCNIGKAPEPTVDVNTIYTSAAQTMISALNVQQTQTAGAATATPNSSPTAQASFTPLPTFAVVSTGSIPFGTASVFGTPGTPGAGVTLLPTLTGGTPGSSTASGCDNSAFISDVTVPDGTVMKPGKDFVKTWAIENTGTCTWDDGYALIYQGGTLDGYDVKIKNTDQFVVPGKTTYFSVNLTASLTPNTYTDCWKMRNDRGAYFGTFICVSIKVQK